WFSAAARPPFIIVSAEVALVGEDRRHAMLIRCELTEGARAILRRRSCWNGKRERTTLIAPSGERTSSPPAHWTRRAGLPWERCRPLGNGCGSPSPLNPSALAARSSPE